MIKKIISKWKKFLKRGSLLKRTIIAFVATIGVILLFSAFLEYNEIRAGVVLYDPIHDAIGPFQLSISTFIITHGAAFVFLFYVISNPRLFFVSFLSYALMLVFRIMAMYVIPLEAPETTIPLWDPVQMFFRGTDVFVDDLFFSGHTATVFLMFWNTYNRKLRNFFLIVAIIIGLSVLFQHAHYSVDVISAIFYSYGAYRLAYNINRSFIDQERTSLQRKAEKIEVTV